jgi:HD-GYP domain-containing protein (c-di-GMP phosphodiesterase class II)
VICELCAHWFDWPTHEIDALLRAALTMNVSMSATQDALARQSGPLSDLQRIEIDQHAERSAAMLASAGVSDALWLDVVRQHHAEPSVESVTSTPALRLAELLHRVDVYTAKLSRRVSRDPVSPALAARDACLNAQGTPDAIGVTLLRVIGLYPPGSFVLLRSGEVGVVVKRGAKAHTPVVALLRRADGGLYSPPVPRDTAVHKQAVLRGVRLAEVKVRVNHERALACA